MYSPRFDDLNSFYGLWSKKTDDVDAALYQPPLYAYSPEYPGSSVLKFNHLVSGDTNKMSPLIQTKLNRLQQIRYYGYKTLRPIGISRTMEQAEYENSNTSETEVTAAQTVENDNSVEEPTDASMSSQRRLHDRDEALPLITPPPPSAEPEDLDNDIPDMDDADDELEEDEGFMAEEVEYQNDHSINEEDMPSSTATGNVNVSLGSNTGTTGLAGSLGRSIATSMTSPMSVRDCEEDMVLDESS